MKNLLKRLFRSWRVKKLAKLDAAVGKYLGKERLGFMFGPRPVLDAIQYPDQVFVLDDLQKGEDVVQELHGSADEPDSDSQLPPTGILILGVALFLFVDVIASNQLMILLGVQSTHRVILGTALACILVALTWGLRSVINQTSSEDGLKMPVWTAIAIVGAYALFLTAAAVLRLSDVAVPEEGTTFADWGGAILLVLATAGPAFLAEECLRALSVSYPRRRQRSEESRELRAAEARVEGAREYMQKVGGRQREWDREFAQFKALYDATFWQKVAADELRNGTTTVDTQLPQSASEDNGVREIVEHVFS